MNPSRSRLVPCATLAALLACASTASAAALTWDTSPGTVGTGDGSITGGAGTWNTSNGNWTSNGGANNTAWTNISGTPKNDAIFGGTAGTVTLGAPISLRNLTINTNNYVITGSTLNFTAGTIVTPNPPNTTAPGATIESNITGAPAVNANALGTNERFTFKPAAGGSMVLGAISGASDTAAGIISFQGGAGSGSVVASVNGPKTYVEGGTWTLTGLASSYGNEISGGTLIISTGTLQNNNRSTTLIGGTLHYNNPAAVNDARTNTGIDNDFCFKGGSLDNTRGTAITTSTYNPDMTWEANWTFIGSNGANSDLFIGTGDVRLFSGVQVTVQNAAATFTVGGVVMDDISTTGSLTKAGPGTLELRGNNTYTGATTVNEGALAIPTGTSVSTISIGPNGILELTPGSTPSTTGGLDFASGSKVRLASAPTLPQYILFKSTGPMTGTPVIETPVPGYGLFIDGRSLKFSQTADADSDGLPDWWELQYSTAVPPNNTSLLPGADLDSDGLTNLQEYHAFTLPTNPDTDADSSLDGRETDTGIWVSASDTGTDPLNPDTDGDGIRDGYETNTGIWVSTTQTGTNPHVTDSDSDSYPDNVETKTGVYVDDSNTGTDPNKADTDGDGAGDWYEIAASFTDPSAAGSNPGVPYPLPDPDGSTGVTNKPVKVFILSGQSNMVGMGTVNGADSIALSYITRMLNRFPNLIDSAGNFIARQDVKYRGVISAIGNGPLAPGFGASSAYIGPELGFGQIMGWLHDEPVLLIKSSIGNRALGWDILPKGTPSWVYEGETFPGYGFPTPATVSDWYAGYEFDRFFLDDSAFAHPHATAEFNVVDVLDNFATQYPSWAAQGFEIAGFVWWQGDRDRYTMGHATQYEANLVKLITELRSYYSNRYPGKVVPNAPFVLATLGQTAEGDTTPEGDVEVFKAQRAVDGRTGKYPQFAGNVKTVYSHPLSEGGASNTHYDRHAGTFMMVGDALGRAMFDLLKGEDITPPTISTLNPADSATGVAIGANLVVSFSEPIALGTGDITLKNLTDVTQTTIAVTDVAQVSASGAVLTINPTANLVGGKSYAIQIAATAIKDRAGNSFAGIADDTTWNFATAVPDTTPPAISTLSPADNATDVALGADLVATFSEVIALGTGNITVTNLTDSTQTTIAVTDATQVSVSGSVLTVNPTANLAAGKRYAIQIAATAIKDSAGNSFAGFADDTTWDFTTANPLPTVSFAPASASGAESATSVTVTVALSHAYAGTVTVKHRLATPAGTATPGKDFVYVPGTLTFNEGETGKSFTFTVVNDTAAEDAETVVFAFGAIGNGAAGSASSHTYTIGNDTADWYAIPFRETFEARTPGSLHGQFGWLAQDADVQGSTTFGGSAQAAAIKADGGYARHMFNDGRTQVWTDMRVRVAYAQQPPVPDTGATAVVYVRSDGRVMAFDGVSPVATSLSVAPGVWARFTIFSDYKAKTWELHVNGVRAGRYGFHTQSATAFTEYRIKGGSSYLDNLGITLDQPFMKGMPSLILVW